MADLAQKIAHSGMILEIPGRQVAWQPLDLGAPRGVGSSRAPAPAATGTLWDRPLPHPQPVVEIAFRAKFLRRNEDAPAGAEGARERDGSIGGVTV